MTQSLVDYLMRDVNGVGVNRAGEKMVGLGCSATMGERGELKGPLLWDLPWLVFF